MPKLYVLRLLNGKWYCGKSSELEARLSQHEDGRCGSAWTKKHGFLRKDAEVPWPPPGRGYSGDATVWQRDGDGFNEIEETSRLMAAHGIDNVRGGPWCRIMLTIDDVRQIKHLIASAEDRCYLCDGPHLCSECHLFGPSSRCPDRLVASESEPPADDRIDRFRGLHFFLSNFAPHGCEFENDTYPTVEHAFQAAKFPKHLRGRVRAARSAYEAKKEGRRADLSLIGGSASWESIKLDVMEACVRSKFTRDAELFQRLLATGHRQILESNHWHDNFWGDCRCQRPACQRPGQNALGTILMKARGGEPAAASVPPATGMAAVDAAAAVSPMTLSQEQCEQMERNKAQAKQRLQTKGAAAVLGAAVSTPQRDAAAIETRRGNLLDARDVQYLVHQVNCVSGSDGRGLSGQIFSRFPHANVYAKAHAGGRKSEPGTICVYGGGADGARGVIGLHAQRYPGPGKHGNDSAALRLSWFERGLEAVGKIPGLKSIAMPTEIGCGMAGGEWAAYRRKINAFAIAHPAIKVVLYEYGVAAGASSGGKRARGW